MTGSSRRAFITLVTVLMVGLLGAGVASGIVYGQPDNGEHPHVGSMVVMIPEAGANGEDGYLQWCSGTLVEGKDDKDVFLTASHCLFGIESFLPPDAEVLVTFDETITPGGTFYSGEIHVNPLYGTHGMADLYDVAVIVLDEKTGIDRYGELPDAGLLDTMKKDGTLKSQEFTAVGYGTIRTTNKKSFANILDNESRNKATQGFNSLTDAWITMDMKNGGTCYGDSGGPHFLGDSDVVVSVTVTGDAPCKATDKTYRLDTANARTFLSQFIQLP